jgi:NAD(P)-dependent dehydrogenase (short-subunit alcohol dehydrogenase family)
MGGRLEGKICIITGSGGAIGRASALMFAREGAHVVGCDLVAARAEETVEQVRASGGSIVSLHPANLTDYAVCLRLVELATSQFGGVDVLFNNAGKAYYGWMPDLAVEDWHRTINEELSIAFLLSKAAWPALCKRGGAIVNAASASGWIAYEALGGLAHCAAKGGIISLTRQLAMEGRNHGIRANSLSPGAIETPATLALSRDPKWAATMTAKIMRGSFGKPEEIAAVALFLASAESSFVNGADIKADGGTTAW